MTKILFLGSSVFWEFKGHNKRIFQAVFKNENPSFFKPQITSEVFLHRKYFTIFFQHLQRDSLRLQEKGNDWWKIGKSPPFFFFNQIIYLKVKDMKEARYAQQLTVKCTKLAIHTMINFLQNSCQLCWHSIHKHCYEFWNILKTCTWRTRYRFKKWNISVDHFCAVKGSRIRS